MMGTVWEGPCEGFYKFPFLWIALQQTLLWMLGDVEETKQGALFSHTRGRC